MTAHVVPPEGGATEFASTRTSPRFRYAPFAELIDAFSFLDETFNKVIRDYNTKDLEI